MGLNTDSLPPGAPHLQNVEGNMCACECASACWLLPAWLRAGGPSNNAAALPRSQHCCVFTSNIGCHVRAPPLALLQPSRRSSTG